MQDTTAQPLNEEIQRLAEQAMQLVAQHLQAGQLDQAAMVCRAVLDMHSAHPQAHFQLGLLEWEARNLAPAAAHLSSALQAAPGEQAYWLSYIELLLDAAEWQAARDTVALGKRHGLRGAALDKLAQRLARAERGAPSQNEIDTITILMKQGRADDVAQAAHLLIKDCPRHAFGHKALGVVLHQRGQLEPAIEAMTAAAQCDPNNAETLSNLGFMLKQDGRLAEAETHLRRSLQLRPRNTDAHNNLAATLLEMGRMADAETSARAALALDPKNVLALNSLAVALQHQNRLPDAVATYRRVLTLEPDNDAVHSNMLFAMNQMEGIDPAALFGAHRRFGEQLEARLAPLLRAHDNDPDPARPLRVGFVSGDLREHAVASFIEPVLERLAGRPQLALYAYHNHVLTDHVSARLRGYMAQWRDVAALSDADLDAQIRADGIDILIDLSGHTAYNRLPLLARKPAPLQATWIGYPGTTGLQAVDYYLTDAHILPPGQYDHQFTEKLLHLPVSAPFQPVLDAPEPGLPPALTNGHITFGSFNRISKIGRDVVAAWGRLLRALPDARLLVGGAPENGGTGQLLAWLADEGVDAARVRLLPRCDLRAYLALHLQVDVLLDSFPYSGGTTTLHALWMGVPTLTIAGTTAAGRQTACILEHSGLPQFIADDADDFARKGVAICADLDALAALRATLRTRFALPSSDAMNQMAASIEAGLRTMWQRWCAGQPAVSFAVPLAPPPR